MIDERAHSRPEAGPDVPPDAALAPTDYLLAALTLPLLLFVLMFATSGMTTMLQQPAARRRWGLVLLLVEVVLVTALVLALT